MKISFRLFEQIIHQSEYTVFAYMFQLLYDAMKKVLKLLSIDVLLNEPVSTGQSPRESVWRDWTSQRMTKKHETETQNQHKKANAWKDRQNEHNDIKQPISRHG